jgi:predicted DNA-binding protein YlxM (UPF0122 family)
MPAIKKLPDSATLRRLRTQGYTQKNIAETFEVSESAVWKALNRAGYTEHVATYKDILPWEVADEHKTTAIMERFRSIVKQNKGAVLRPEEETRLNLWLRELEMNGLVVNYHPDAPPNSASSKGGFYYVPKTEEDTWILKGYPRPW